MLSTKYLITRQDEKQNITSSLKGYRVGTYRMLFNIQGKVLHMLMKRKSAQKYKATLTVI